MTGASDSAGASSFRRGVHGAKIMCSSRIWSEALTAIVARDESSVYITVLPSTPTFKSTSVVVQNAAASIRRVCRGR
eukprot:1971492-Rhodomonas_salina.1